MPIALLAAQLIPQLLGGVQGLFGGLGSMFGSMFGGIGNNPQNNFQNNPAQQAQSDRFLDLLEKLVKQNEQSNQAALGNMTNGCCSSGSGVFAAPRDPEGSGLNVPVWAGPALMGPRWDGDPDFGVDPNGWNGKRPIVMDFPRPESIALSVKWN